MLITTEGGWSIDDPDSVGIRTEMGVLSLEACSDSPLRTRDELEFVSLTITDLVMSGTSW